MDQKSERVIRKAIRADLPAVLKGLDYLEWGQGDTAHGSLALRSSREKHSSPKKIGYFFAVEEDLDALTDIFFKMFKDSSG